MTSYLVMLQTNSNQPFIFSSPRLREQIGASFEITLLSRWVSEVAQDLVSKNRPGKNKRRTNFWVSNSSGKVIGLFAFEGVGVLGGDSACRGRVGVEVFR